ncbi:HMG1/2-like protein isoform X1 [Impatiens glandulifera]|uniref:HMG1/2-like protein isoform X1 n=1 Tax=Impatiens glandulifera TaxID=253017 RepID=UPI001FB14F0A|nr:HMG1/2-like protein isoform X1 [Impatiens glandulifera]
MRAPTAGSVAHKKLDSSLVKKLKADTGMKKEKVKKKKDSGAPKRPPSAFFVFMDDFRKTYKENFPENKSVANVTKAGGAKWKTMSEPDKATYIATAAKKKVEYDKLKEEFNRKQTSSNMNVISEDYSRSTSEVSNEIEQEGSS